MVTRNTTEMTTTAITATASTVNMNIAKAGAMAATAIPIMIVSQFAGGITITTPLLPPGLAKRDRLPPGLERQLVVRGFLPVRQLHAANAALPT